MHYIAKTSPASSRYHIAPGYDDSVREYPLADAGLCGTPTECGFCCD